MRKKYVALAMGVMLMTSLYTGCGTSSTTSTSAEATTEAGSNTIYGQIDSIDDDSITIEVGTMKEMEKPDQKADSSDTAESSDTANSDSSDSTEATTDSAKSSDDQTTPEQGEFSMLDLTGETETITVSSDTKITKQSFAGGPGGQGGQAPSGQAPNGQAPSTDSSSAPEGNTGDDSSQPPAKPDGDSSNAPEGNTGDDSSQPPAKPDGDSSSAPEGNTGDSNSQTAGDAASQTDEEISLSDLSEGDTISVTTDQDGNVTEITLMSGGGMHGGHGGGQTSGVDSYASVQEYTSDTESDGDEFNSTGTDENAVLVSNGATVTLDNSTVKKNSDDSTGGDNSSFYGVGAAVLTIDGTTTLNNAKITTDANGGAGVFSYGENSKVYVNDSSITTEKGTSGGIHVAGGGTLYANNLKVETNGESSAAIRSDRGGGTMEVTKGSYTSNGTGSPAVYCTADIDVSDATLTATKSEAICIEGLNSLKLTDCDLTGNMPESDQNDCTWNVILYQSNSGDSEEGNSTFTMKGGSLTAKNGGMFYTTNTESTFNLEDVDITNSDENDFFLKCTGNSNARGWGTSGDNGAKCTFNATDQTMEGDVIWDSISTLDFTMEGNSTLTAAITDDESNAGDGGEGYANLSIGEDSTWIVTGDSTLTKLTNAGTIVDEDGNTVSVKGSDGTTYVDGTSSYTITVSSYEGK